MNEKVYFPENKLEELINLADVELEKKYKVKFGKSEANDAVEPKDKQVVDKTDAKS